MDVSMAFWEGPMTTRRERYLHGEIVGVDDDGYLMVWEANLERAVSTSETPESYGYEFMTLREVKRLDTINVTKEDL